jgi:hypothetical protein
MELRKVMDEIRGMARNSSGALQEGLFFTVYFYYLTSRGVWSLAASVHVRPEILEFPSDGRNGGAVVLDMTVDFPTATTGLSINDAANWITASEHAVGLGRKIEPLIKDINWTVDEMRSLKDGSK